MKAMTEFTLVNIINKLLEFDLITKNQAEKIIKKNRQRMGGESND